MRDIEGTTSIIMRRMHSDMAAPDAYSKTRVAKKSEAKLRRDAVKSEKTGRIKKDRT